MEQHHRTLNAMNHLLLSTDLSDRSLSVAKLAIELFGAAGNEFTLAHAYSAAGLNDPMMPGMIPDLQQVNEESLTLFEERLRAACDLSQAQVHRVAAFGPLSALINDLAREKHVDLVVMGAPERNGSSLFGSHTTSVMQGTHVPVLEIPTHSEALSFKHILFADDRSAIEEQALSMLVTIARIARSEILIAHVATGRAANEQVDNTEVLDRVLAEIPHRHVVVEDNDVEKALLDLAAKENVGLIAVLHRHAGLWNMLFHASVTKAVALHSTVPVLALEQ
jgi:nucleotide-binding universal stress UspA family protein